MNAIAQQLRDELRAADTVIRNALAVMTMDQKGDWGCANERDDVAGEGVTRYHERQVVIAGGSPLAVFLELRRADRIIGNAWEIQSFHQHALWSTANQQDGVAVTHPTRADSRSKVLAAAIAAAHELVGDARGSIADAIVGYVKGFGDAVRAEPGKSPGVDAVETVAVLKPIKMSYEDIATIRREFASARNCHTVLIRDEASAPAASMTPAARDVLAERRRQVDVEGYTLCSDDGNRAGVMSAAAAAYALIGSGWSQAAALEFWPEGWASEYWKPAGTRRNLVKAAALLLAEIERIDRQAAKTNTTPHIPQPRPMAR
ncbi:hypothetical protein [Burkholderia vietnamiensis]|uniref:hypothetical protein n=1 Tax=Burkholderia vietnamiensis TaxID=60552 RepID=UPI001CF580AF|nr:hypothetical protein [Burkholderia vietnamiensis]MCA8198915.1 hypothetical protein [Burkholderia vietnamiensis]